MAGALDEVMAEALEAAKRDAVQELRRRLAASLVEAAEQRWAIGASEPGPPAPAGAPAVSANRPPVPAAAGPDRGWYVYGFAREADVRDLGAGPGVDGAPVEVMAVGRLAVVGSWVAAGDGLWGVDARGEADLDGLAPRLAAHEEVLERVLERGPVLPMRFGRLYAEVGPLKDLLQQEGPAVWTALDRLEGKAEWGLTLEAAASATGEAHEEAGVAGREAGKYLARRRSEIAEAGEAARVVRVQANRIHDSVSAAACGHFVHPVRRISGGPTSAVFRASYLVPDSDLEAFRRAAADALASAPGDLGLTGELTGPWPPYHFAEIDLDAMPA